MKKRFYFLLIIVTIILTGCVSPIKYDYEYLRETVTKVEIINVTHSYDYLEYDVLKIIEEEKFDEFLKDFSNLEYYQLYSDRVELNGICIKIMYTDNSFDVFAQSIISKYSSSGEEYSSLSRYVPEEKYKNIIEKYS